MNLQEDLASAKCVYAGDDHALHVVHDEATRRDVLLKSYRGSDAPARAQREFELLKALAGPGIVQVYGIETSASEPYLVLQSLEDGTLGCGQPLPIGDWIDVATQLAASIRHVHAKHWLLRCIHPVCLLTRSDPPEVRLIDVRHAAEYGSAISSGVVGDAAYMAPEQFGRMGRGTDFRSDLYSLGATLYYLLTGQPPFPGDDLLELMHAHMAHRPRAPSELRPDVPRVLGDLVLKLLQKEPDDRYQTACTLHTDLLELQQQWAQDSEIREDFVLARGDAQNRPLFSRRLYGRDAEVEALAGALDRVRAGGCELWLLRGPPGIGKSVLIEELRRRSIRDGWLVQGKFDLYQRDHPYSGWAAALESLAQQVLVRGASEIGSWRQRLEEHLGPNVSVLAEWLPDWRFVLGDVPPAPRLRPRETQARLARTVVRLLQAAARPAQPLVVFLDDLQWTDSGSRLLLQEVMHEKGAPGLLLVATYRDGEVAATHPLKATLDQIREEPVPIGVLQIQPLTRDATLDMLSDVFEKPRDAVESLADLVLTKTENNPFLIQQFLDHMRNLGHVSFSGGHGWTWSLADIASADISDDAVELIAARIEHVEPHAREVLVFASFIGDEFSAELLRELANRDLDAVEFALCALSEAGLVAPCSTGFRFVHDRIREAAQSLKSEEERSLLHYDTASLLVDRTSTGKLRERAAEIADHFKRARHRIPAERVPKAVQLDVWAAERALATGAPDTARGYVDHAHDLVELHSSRLDPELSFQLDFLRAQTRIVAFEYAEATEIARLLAERSEDPIRFATATALRIEILAFQIREEQSGWSGEHVERAFQIGTAAFRRLRAPYPLNPSGPRALFEVLRAYQSIRHLTADDFLHELPEPDEKQRALMRIEAAFGGISFERPYRGLTAISFRIRRFRDGYAGGFLPGGLVSLGATVQSVFGWREAADRLAETSLELLERGYPAWMAGPTRLGAHLLVFGWSRHPIVCAENIEKSFAVSMEGGDLLYASAGASVSTHMRFRAGEPLDRVLAAYHEGEALARSAYDRGLARSLHGSIQMLECLRHPRAPAPGSSPLDTELTPYTGLICGFVWLVFQDDARALAALNQALETDGIPDNLSFHRALACTGLLGSSAACDRRRIKRILRRDRRRLARLARRFPENRLHQRLLIDAEWARLRGRDKLAVEKARTSVERARAQSFPVDAALALERLARMLFDANRVSEATEKIRQAMQLYEDFGATAKVEQLRSQHARNLGALGHGPIHR